MSPRRRAPGRIRDRAVMSEIEMRDHQFRVVPQEIWELVKRRWPEPGPPETFWCHEGPDHLRERHPLRPEGPPLDPDAELTNKIRRFRARRRERLEWLADNGGDWKALLR